MILTHGANSLERGGGDTVTIGGRAYKTVTIGNQVWLAENLDYKFSGCDIGPTGSPTTPAAWYYNNDEATYGIDGVRKCGLLYNWYSVKLLNDNKTTLIHGWHVPTKNEWEALANAVGGTTTAGTKLKSSNVSWATSWGGTDDYGFGALPAGGYGGSFSGVGSYGSFWTSTDANASLAYFKFFQANSANMGSNTSYKTDAVSIRLVKDAP